MKSIPKQRENIFVNLEKIKKVQNTVIEKYSKYLWMV